MENNFVVQIKPGEQNIYNYLKRFFRKTSYTFQPGKVIPVDLNHKEPFVEINGQRKVLLYPKEALDLSKNFWNDQRTGIFFRGFIPDFRAEALKQWQGIATIEGVNVGRKSITRFWDESYLSATGKAEFVLCPRGGWHWSYRFYEAVLCGAIPIVEIDSDNYKGYFYFKWNDRDNLHFDWSKAIHNFILAQSQLTFTNKIPVL